MWSYIQYRRIGKQAIEEFRTKSGQPTDDSNHTPRNFSALEHGKTSSQREGPQAQLEESKLPVNQKQPEKTNNSSNTKDDKIVVRTSGEDDPFDPRNWPLISRCKNIAILAFLIFVQAWAGAASSMANTAASQEFHISKVAENLSTAMYLFGISSGSLFVGPLSEMVGRNPTYLVATFCYLFFVLGSALTPTFGGQLVCRYFVGLFSSATLAINGGSVRDQFRPVKRAFVFPVIAWANVAGQDPLFSFYSSGSLILV